MRWNHGKMLALSVAVLAACAPHESTGPPAGEMGATSWAGLEALENTPLVDLTYAFDENTIYWPTAATNFELEELSYGPTEAGFFYSAYAFRTPEHGGTHLDAPIHFAEGRHTVDQIPLESLVGPGVVLDVSQQAAADPDYRLTPEDVQRWEAEHGPVPAGAIVLLRTGWGQHWPDRKAYLGDDTPGDASNLHFPSFGAAAAQWLVEERKVAVLGVDTASIDHGPSRDFPVHQVANGANVPGLENVAHLDRLPATGAWIMALPMKIAGGSGAPVRIVALLPGV